MYDVMTAPAGGLGPCVTICAGGRSPGHNPVPLLLVGAAISRTCFLFKCQLLTAAPYPFSFVSLLLSPLPVPDTVPLPYPPHHRPTAKPRRRTLALMGEEEPAVVKTAVHWYVNHIFRLFDSLPTPPSIVKTLYIVMTVASTMHAHAAHEDKSVASDKWIEMVHFLLCWLMPSWLLPDGKSRLAPPPQHARPHSPRICLSYSTHTFLPQRQLSNFPV